MNFLSWFYTLRSYMDSYLWFLKGTRFWSLLWVTAICVIIWFYGASIAIDKWRPLEDEFRRLVLIGVIIAGWLIYLIVSAFRRRRKEKALIEGLTDDAIDPEATAREEVSELQSRLKEALLKMRSITKKRFNFVYDFPWYMIIGSPGSGKTTALLNSGLSFPLGDDLDGEGVGGVGGTRSCDWWFTDEAILIDTAGRYTSQDSDATVDSTAWQGFLALLKKHRPLKPVNGIIITLSLEDTLTQSPQARLKEVRTIRQRLRDLEETLKVRLPIYLIFTKVDMISGFSEFFDSFNKFDREQVLGTTFPLGVSQAKGKVGDALGAQYDLILDRLNRMLIERMQQEPDDIRRSRVFRFPAQFAALKTAIVEQVAELTAASKLTTAPIVRGVYFVSAMQSGQVHDRIRSSVSERFAFLPDRAADGTPGHKPFFLSRLFSDVIFGEANLVTTDLKLQRRKRILTTVLYSLPVILACVLAAGWTSAWFANRATVQAINENIALYNRDATTFKVEDVDDGDIARTVEPLNNLRVARYVDIPGTDKWYHFVLAQEDKLASSIDRSYARGLNGLLLPRLLIYLQNGMQEPGIDAGDLYNKLKAYLMLGGLGPIDPAFVRDTLAVDFEKRFPGAGRDKFRKDLNAHVDALTLLPDLRVLTLDETLINDARKALRAKSPAERIYQVVVASPLAAQQVEWRLSDKAGSMAGQLLQRRSGKPLQEGIRGIYTRKGFYAAVLGEVDQAADRFVSEKWVLGDDYTAGLTADDVKRDVMRLYLTDFQKEWSGLLQDVTVRTPTDLQQATALVGLMTAANNPLQSLALAIGKDTDLTPRAPEPEAAAAPQAGAAGNGIVDAAGDAASRVSSTAGQAVDAAGKLVGAAGGMVGAGEIDLTKLPVFLLDDFGENIIDPYRPLREYVSAKGEQPSTFAGIGEVFNELFRQLSRAATNPGEVQEIFGVKSALAAANQQLLTEAQRMPSPLDAWLGTLATDIGRLTASGARQSLSDLWETTGGLVCKRAIAGRYPFVRGADNDVAIDDFAQMFGPSGHFATFFELHLKPFVDVSSSPWQWTGLAGNEAVASEALAQFEAARRIQSAFFAGGSELNVTLDITPIDLDINSTSVLLSINDQTVTYDHGPVQTKSLKWPGDGNRTARLTFMPEGANTSFTRTGPWAMFKLFDEAKQRAASEDKFGAVFSLGKRSASFEIQTGSVLNPFSLPELSSFKCPERL